MPDKGEQNLADAKPEFAHFRFVDHNVFADAIHPVINFHVDGPVFQLDAKGVVEEHGIALPPGQTLADHITGSADVCPRTGWCQRPDAGLFFAIVKHEILVQRADTICPTACNVSAEMPNRGTGEIFHHAMCGQCTIKKGLRFESGLPRLIVIH